MRSSSRCSRSVSGAVLVASLTASCGLAVPLARAQCVPSFLNAVPFAAGSRPYSLACADFNGDGKPDLAVANAISNDVSILLGNGDGTFGTAASFFSGSSPASIAIADLDNDGKLDLVVANFAGSTVSVLLGNGDGTFKSAVPYPTGQFPSSVVVADFNGDGKPDLAVAASGADAVSIHLGVGDGTFLPHADYTTSTYPIAIAVGDVNGDSKLDLVTANNANNTATILLGAGDGTFTAVPTNPPAGPNPTAVAIADFNGDGKPDLAVANKGFGDSISVLQGNGNGTFQPRVPYGAGNQPNWLSIGDFNGDAKPDIAVANMGSDSVSVLQGVGDGTFLAGINKSMGTLPQSVIAADVNSDGHPDLVGASTDGVWVLLNNLSSNPSPTFTQQPLPTRLLYQAGQTISISVVVDGHSSVVSYQWRRNGIALADAGRVSGSTTPTLSIANAVLTDTAQYDVLASTPACGGGSLVSASSAIVVPVTDAPSCPPPQITSQPTGLNLLPGTSGSFTIAASSGATPAYQWRKGGVNLVDGTLPSGTVVSGATTSTLTISSVALADNATAFDCVVSSTCGAVTSVPVGLAVVAPPSCYPNCDGNTTPPLLSAGDFVCFLQKFRQGCP